MLLTRKLITNYFLNHHTLNHSAEPSDRLSHVGLASFFRCTMCYKPCHSGTNDLHAFALDACMLCVSLYFQNLAGLHMYPSSQEYSCLHLRLCLCGFVALRARAELRPLIRKSAWRVQRNRNKRCGSSMDINRSCGRSSRRVRSAYRAGGGPGENLT